MYAIYDQVSVLVILALGIPAAGFLLRTFIVFHDCGHGSFWASKRANRWFGRFCAVLVWQPFANWRHDHAVHHGSAGDLDRRGTGDVPTLTVEEYYERDWRGRLAYRLFRNPLVMFGIGPIFSLMIAPRLTPLDKRRAPAQQRPAHQHRARGHHHRDLPAARLEAVHADRAAGRLRRGRVRRGAAVLRPAPVRGRLLGDGRPLELHRRGAAGQLVPEAAARCCSSSPATSGSITSTT